MNDQQTATTILALEECIEQYATDCRRRVDGFVQRHSSLQETIALQKQSLASDLLFHPANALWAIPSLFLKKLIEIPVKLGWRSGADLITLLPPGLKTRYQKEIERLIATELLEWPCTMKDRRACQNGLLERIERHKQVGPMFKSAILSDEALRELPEIHDLIAAHSASRAMVLDTSATVLTLATGWFVFGDHSLSISEIGEKIAAKRARDRAASKFILGSSLGSAFYSVFPPNPSFWEVVGGHAHGGTLHCDDELSRRTVERSLSQTGRLPVHAAPRADRCRGGLLASTGTKAFQACAQTTRGLIGPVSIS
jgi:hypothetical protein